MKKYILLLFIITALNLQAETVVKIIGARSKNDTRQNYYLNMLSLALEKSKDRFGEYRIEPTNKEIVQSRIAREVQKGESIDLFWTMTSKQREEDLLPVRIPLLKGLLGYRIFIINKGDQYKFDKINSLEDLKLLKAGQGHDWPDTQILKASGLTVVGSAKYESLFRMLTKDRFDYFPRGVNEPWSEIKTFEVGNLAVEKNLMIKYPAPIYFFVSKTNTKLAKRIEYGLNKAIEDGSFDKLFYNDNSIKQIFELSNLNNRKTFKIDNPLLSKESKNILNIKKYWYSN